MQRRLVWAGVLLFALAGVIAYFGGALATRAYLDQASSRGQTTLRLAVAALRGQMNRYESLPALIADHDDIKELLADPANAALRARANVYLKEINALLESSDIYVMMPDGETIAASNYDGPTSFVGENFSYRPYFQDAIEGRQGALLRARHDLAQARLLFLRAGEDRRRDRAASSSSRSTSTPSRPPGRAATTRSSSPTRRHHLHDGQAGMALFRACCR